MQLAAVAVVDEDADVEVLRGLLRAKGIESWCRRTDVAVGAWTGWACTGGPVELLVREQDVEAAHEVLPELRAAPTATD